jgi:hypothetical protein
MGYDGTGVYTRTHNFSADASAGIKILAARVDAEFNDFASAMNLALLADGRNAATGNLPMGGFRHVGVGAPASATNYMRSKDFIENVPVYMVDAEASADRISVSSLFYTTASAATAPRDGSHVLIKAGSDKSSAVAIRLNTGDGSPHSAAVVLANGSALYSGAIRSGGIYEFIWSSSDTAWQLFNPQVDYATSAYPGVILLATAAEVAAGTDTPHAVTPSQLASKFSASYATETSAGLIELATTAEGIAGSNVSVAITPAVLDAVLSTYTATVTSAGVIEIATTAEATAGTDTSRAITAATLAAVAAKSEPYLVYVSVSDASGGAEILSKNAKASAWTIAHVSGFPTWTVTHNIGLSSAGELNINISQVKVLAANEFELQTLSASAFSFAAWNLSVSASVGNGLYGQLFIQAHRIV